MEKKVIKNELICLDNKQYQVNFFQVVKIPGHISYYSEISCNVDQSDKMVIDDDDLCRLENRIRLIIPVAHRCRRIARMGISG